MSEDLYYDHKTVFEISAYIQKGICYHPMIIHYCLQLSTSSSYAYDELRYDENHGTGILVEER